MNQSASAVATLWSASIGKKAVMAVTGVVLVGFVAVHMLGNLKIFLGEAAFNDYAVFLREMGHPLLPHEGALWIARVVLLACVAFHMAAALQLTLMSRAARPIPYEDKTNLQATYAARTMRWGGVIIGLFVIYHLLHFTLGVVGYQPGQFEHLSVYRNVVTGFSVWYVSLFYIVAMGMLGFHLYHGVWSLFQTLGARDIRGSGLYRGLAGVLALGVSLGNISIPLAVLTGALR